MDNASSCLNPNRRSARCILDRVTLSKNDLISRRANLVLPKWWRHAATLPPSRKWKKCAGGRHRSRTFLVIFSPRCLPSSVGTWTRTPLGVVNLWDQFCMVVSGPARDDLLNDMDDLYDHQSGLHPNADEAGQANQILHVRSSSHNSAPAALLWRAWPLTNRGYWSRAYIMLDLAVAIH